VNISIKKSLVKAIEEIARQNDTSVDVVVDILTNDNTVLEPISVSIHYHKYGCHPDERK
jgi:hypothetical protein